MAKPKPNDTEAVSLFPFLSILACLIGVLTFIITGVAISQMDQSEDIAAIERTEKYDPLMAQLEADKAELKRLQAQRNAQQVLDEQIKQAQAKIKQAKQRIAQLADREKTIKQAESIRLEITKVNSQIETVKPKLDELSKKVQADEVELNKRIEAGRPAGTIVRPSGSGVGLKPNFVECDKQHLILFTGGKQTLIPYAKITQSPPFLALLERVAKQEKRRVVFLLRPEGVRTYNAASRVAREKQCRYGKIPVPGEGPLDLSMFD